MYHLKSIVFLVFASLYLNSMIMCSPLTSDGFEIHSSGASPVVSYRAVETQQVEDVKEPIAQEPIKQEPVVQEPVKQEPVKEEPVKEEPVKEEPVKTVQEPIKTESHEIVENEKTEEERETDRERIIESCGEKCLKAKPDYSKAIAIAAKGNALAGMATAKVAAIPVIKSAKVAALAALIPVKLAAKGAIIGTLIAKPIIIKSALVGATAAKLSHIFVGKPITIGANILAGAEALRAKIAAKKKGCVSNTCA